jgi:hypothetical protein
MNSQNEITFVEHRGSGKVNWPAFLPWAGLTLLVCAGMAYGMDLLFQHGYYYFPIVAIFAALVCAGTVISAIHKGHCRNSVIGMLFGLTAALVAYLGYYYAGMISNIGPDMATRPDLLPKYIVLRKNSEVTGDFRRAGKGGIAPQAPVEIVQFGNRIVIAQRLGLGDVIPNWIFFALEFALIAFLAAGAGFVRARRTYCEGCCCWLTMNQAVFPFGSGQDVAESVTSGDLKSLRSLQTIPMPHQGSYTSLAVEYCPPDEGQPSTCPAYVSVKDVRRGGGIGQINQFEAAFGTTRLRRYLIGKEQIVELIPLVPSLAKLVDSSTARAVTEREAAVPRLAETRGAFAEISPVDEPFAGKIMSKKTLLIGNALGILILPLFLGAGVMMLGGFYLCTNEAKDDGWPAALTDNGPLIAGLGIPLFILSTYIGLRCPTLFGEWYLRRHAKNEIRSRPDWIVDPDDPEAHFVQIVPRCNWGRIMLETATDHGFLKIDENRREILFEGDKERYRIPGRAVISCDVEQIVYGEGTAGRMIQYTTVLRAHTATGIWENPIGQRGDFGTLGAKKRLRLARELRDKMLSVQG